MDWELVYYFTSLSISIVLSLGIARYAWRRRSVPGAEYFALFMLGAVLWAFGTLLTLVISNELFLILANAVAASGIVVMPIAWLAFTLEYTGRGKWLTKRTWALITVPPIVGLLLLYGTGIIAPMQQEGGLDVSSPGPLFIIGLLTAFVSIALLLLSGTLLIIHALIQAPKMYRRQYYALLIGVWCPWIFGLLSMGGEDQAALGLLPLGAAIGGLVATWGFFRYQVFDVMPIALDTVIESISDGVIVLDTQHRIVDLNPAAQSMTRLSDKQGAGLPITQALGDWKEFVHCLDQAQSQAEMTLHEPDRFDAIRSDTVVKGKDGGYFELRISPLYDRREALSGRLVLLHDISARVQAEEALRESWETLKLAMEGANVGFFHLRIRSDETVLLRAWSPGRGDEPEESESTVEGWFRMDPVHPDDRPKFAEAFETHVSGKTPFYEVEYRGRTESGEWEWMVQRGQVVARDENDQPLRIAGMVQDISARVQAQEELHKARRAAEDANRAKSDFLANMSHELRTPLNAILGFSQLMTRDSSLTSEQRENLETIGRSGEHLLGLINDVLELSKIEAGRVALQEESFDLHRLLDGLEEMFHLRALEKGLMLIFDRAPDVPQYLRADEGKLRQVLMNLLGNAVKFTREGGVTLRVGMKGKEPLRDTQDRPWSLIFEVEDTGPGIAPEELDAVFDPFTQTASGQKSHEGTGLGMPISRQFVRLMGGDLTLSSELGTGSLFRFDVQVQLADAAEVPTAQPKRWVIGLEPDQRAADGGPYRLLVVEDREANRRLLVKLLEPMGFELREAVNGQEGIEVWQRWKPHLIWMDMRMPVMDGYEAAQRIKATTQGQATVIVALTASAFDSDRAMILSGGCDDYVRKPFREEEIFDTLAKHLGVRFVYEEGAQATGVAAKAAEGTLTTAALAALPADWVTKLHQAATQLEADLILDLLGQIREQHAPLADALESLVHDFRFDTILALTAGEEGNEQRGI